jgi:hypothetical protein
VKFVWSTVWSLENNDPKVVVRITVSEPFSMPSSTSQLLHVLVAQIELRKVSSLASLRPNENTTIAATFEVSLALDRSIIFASRLIERHSDPDSNTGDLGHHANV